ncbi:hypothetical protein H0H93_010005, partial [Arthromyces matolae]
GVFTGNDSHDPSQLSSRTLSGNDKGDLLRGQSLSDPRPSGQTFAAEGHSVLGSSITPGSGETVSQHDSSTNFPPPSRASQRPSPIDPGVHPSPEKPQTSGQQPVHGHGTPAGKGDVHDGAALHTHAGQPPNDNLVRFSGEDFHRGLQSMWELADDSDGETDPGNNGNVGDNNSEKKRKRRSEKFAKRFGGNSG